MAAPAEALPTGPEPSGPGCLEWSRLLPHRPPMLLLETLAEAGPGGGTAYARVDPEAWYADPEGAMPAWIGLELMAQAAAACRGAQLAVAGPAGAAPRSGYLVAARGFRSEAGSFPAGAVLELRVRLEDADPSGLCAFACEIRQAGRILAGATLKVMERP
jgi:predicted hotdog family 3-hydroxylacyl-ACP dehydratase